MKTIIAGDIVDYELFVEAMRRINWEVSEIVSGGSRVDILGERWAKESNVAVKVFSAEWDVYGKAAGPIRNAQMAKYADALIALWDGKSHGTSNMINEAKELGLKVVVFLENELKNKKTSNPIKNNPIFGDDAEEKASKGQRGGLPTIAVELNGKHLVIYEDSTKNQPLVNMIVELVNEVKKLKGEI